MKFFSSGYLLSGTDAHGGYAVVGAYGQVLETGKLAEPGAGRFEAELRGLCRAIGLAHNGDVIVSSSRTVLQCVQNGRSKSHPKANASITKAGSTAAKKKLRLEFLSADRNLAALYNDRSAISTSQHPEPGASSSGTVKLERHRLTRTRNAPESANHASHIPGLRILADVRSKRVEFLWQNLIPLGEITIIEGHPGTNKSLLTADLAARVTRGVAMPCCDRPLMGKAGALFLIGEDSIAKTVRSRLHAADADLKRIGVLDGITASQGLAFGRESHSPTGREAGRGGHPQRLSGLQCSGKPSVKKGPTTFAQSCRENQCRGGPLAAFHREQQRGLAVAWRRQRGNYGGRPFAIEGAHASGRSQYAASSSTTNRTSGRLLHRSSSASSRAATVSVSIGMGYVI